MALVVDGGIILLHCTDAYAETGSFSNWIKVFQGWICEFISGLNFLPDSHLYCGCYSLMAGTVATTDLTNTLFSWIFQLIGGYF